jgi:Kef-type K+ transport system membrane component KefB/nucleotide-binding universal stress UspA family protein
MRVARWLAMTGMLTAAGPAPAAAAAAGEAAKGPSEPLFVLQLMILLIVGRLLGEVMLRLKQPAVMGQLIAGLVLGPSLFGALFPDLQQALFPKDPAQKAMLSAVAEFGILLLLLMTGMETDLKIARQSGRASICASLAGIAVPFACGVLLGEHLPDSMLPDPDKRLITSLFLGTALSIASVKIVATVVREMNFMRRTVGQVILASAIIDDSVGWIIIAIIFSLALNGHVDAWSIAQAVIGTIVFMIVSLTIGRRIVSSIIRWVNDYFVSDFAVITAILLIMGGMGLITHLIGVHTVLGAFVAGILVGESPILTKHIDEQLRGLIISFFMPVFFATAGLSADLTILKDVNLLLLTIGLIAIASIGKFGGAFIGGEIGGLTRRESLALACGMNARGSTEVIVATIGLSMGALSQNLFTMIVAMAVITTTAMPPTLRWALSRVPMRKEEKQRIEREEMEKKSFVANLERLLLAVDDSANAHFASRVAGTIAGTRGMPTTVLHITSEKKAEKQDDKKDEKNTREKDGKTQKAAENNETAAEQNAFDEVTETVRAAAEQIKRQQKKTEKSDAKVEIRKITEAAPSSETVAEEAEKGYDILVIGLEKTLGRGAAFHAGVTTLASGFDGALLIADARGDLLARPTDGQMSILLPVNGSELSRNAAEVAITMARATKSPLTALYVASRPDSGNGKKRPRRSTRVRAQEDAILKSIVQMADNYNTEIKTSVRANEPPDEAILKEADRRKHNLIIVGVERLPGDKLFFGNTAAALLDNAKCSIVLVAT